MAEPESRPITEVVEDAAGKQLGIGRWDRPAIFRETAEAATDADLPYWMVLLLSGAIATLGLATDSSAVVIGAMLVAPLLAPVVGLALSLAAGDGRLAVQAAAVVLGSTLAVIGVGALLTAALPFQTITLEISARTRPTTLDLGVAVFSGLAGALVTVARGHRLSAAIPGVAISVALIPPLAVAGFGIGSGWNGELIRGSLLLYGANLAGIVLSGMLVFLLIGMHRPDVLESARRWHREEEETSGLAAWADRLPWVRSLGVLRSTWTRIALVLGFVVAVGIPLGTTLEQIAREQRVHGAVERAAGAVFERRDRSSILHREVVMDGGRTQVYLQVATTEWFGEEAREEFERRASAMAAEPVRVVLEQLPVSRGGMEALAELFPERRPRPVPGPSAPPPLPELLTAARGRLGDALASLPLPAGVLAVGAELAVREAGGAVVRVAYASPAPLASQAEEVLVRQLGRALEVPGLEVEFSHVATAPRYRGDTIPAPAALREVPALLALYPALRAEVAAGALTDSARVDSTVAVLRGAGVSPERIVLRRDGSAEGITVRVLPAPRQETPERE